MYDTQKHIHVMNCGSEQMGSLMLLLMHLGYQVSGCDLRTDSPHYLQLAEYGHTLFVGHCPSHLATIDLLVHPVQAPHSLEEIRNARSHGIPTITHGELLAHVLRNHDLIGTIGHTSSTTITALIGHLLAEGNVSPTTIVNGFYGKHKRSVQLGRSQWAIVDMESSIDAMQHLTPTIVVLPDHLSNENAYLACMQVLEKMPFYGSIILNNDAAYAGLILKRFRNKVITYSTEDQAQMYAQDVTMSRFGSIFNVVDKHDGLLGTIKLNLPGTQAISHAIAAITVAYRLLHIPFRTIAQSMPKFSGVAYRCEVAGQAHGIMVMQDKGQSLAAIAATLHTATRAVDNKLHVIWHPQGYSFLHQAWSGLGKVFSKYGEKIASLHLFAVTGDAYEEANYAVTNQSLLETLRTAAPNVPLFYYDDQITLQESLQPLLRPGDTVCTIGAEDARSIGRHLLERAVKPL